MKPWYVITGAPSSGKSTTLDALAHRGYLVVPEAAREEIDSGIAQGLTLAQIRADEAGFQSRVLQRKLKTEAELPADKVVFFDRGMHDSVAYMRLHGADVTEASAASANSIYRKVFLMDPLALNPDYARTEDDAQAQKIDKLLEQVYLEYGFEVVRIPTLRAEERVALILENID